jgi:uncharacterized membrane protein YfcA
VVFVVHFELWQWALAVASALLIGLSKTGIPGIGILVVPMLAYAFGGRESVGIMLPMLICADCFAVLWYRQHAQWDKLLKLYPWVLSGLAIGFIFLWKLDTSGAKDVLTPIIGWLVLIMIGIHVFKGKMGEHFAPSSRIGVVGTGTAAGFTTMVSNAAGPIMSIYMLAQKMDKNQFIGTFAWYFFTINLLKFPLYLCLGLLKPQTPMITGHSLILDAIVLPAIILGAFVGKWLLPKIPLKTFENMVLILAAAAALKLVWPQ